MKARWPDVGEIDELLLKESEYLAEVSHDFRVRLKKMLELREKVGGYWWQCAEVVLGHVFFCCRKQALGSSLGLTMGSSMWQMDTLVGKLWCSPNYRRC